MLALTLSGKLVNRSTNLIKLASLKNGLTEINEIKNKTNTINITLKTE